MADNSTKVTFDGNDVTIPDATSVSSPASSLPVAPASDYANVSGSAAAVDTSTTAVAQASTSSGAKPFAGSSPMKVGKPKISQTPQSQARRVQAEAEASKRESTRSPVPDRTSGSQGRTEAEPPNPADLVKVLSIQLQETNAAMGVLVARITTLEASHANVTAGVEEFAAQAIRANAHLDERLGAHQIKAQEHLDAIENMFGKCAGELGKVKAFASASTAATSGTRTGSDVSRIDLDQLKSHIDLSVAAQEAATELNTASIKALEDTNTSKAILIDSLATTVQASEYSLQEQRAINASSGEYQDKLRNDIQGTVVRLEGWIRDAATKCSNGCQGQSQSKDSDKDQSQAGRSAETSETRKKLLKEGTWSGPKVDSDDEGGDGDDGDGNGGGGGGPRHFPMATGSSDGNRSEDGNQGCGERPDKVFPLTKASKNPFDTKDAKENLPRYNGRDKRVYWRKMVSYYLYSKSVDMGPLLQWAEKQTTPITTASLLEPQKLKKFPVTTSDPEVLSHHLWGFLNISLLEDAWDIFDNAEIGHGLEVWRLVNIDTMQKTPGELMEMEDLVQNPKRITRVADIAKGIVAWDITHRELKEAGGAEVAKSRQVNILTKMLPSEFKQHVLWVFEQFKNGPAALRTWITEKVRDMTREVPDAARQ